MKNRFHRLKEIFSSKIKPKMKNKKVFWGSIAGCAGLAIILAGGFFLQAKGASKNQTETTVQSAEAKTGTISTTVEGTGSVSNGTATDVVVPTGIKVKEVLVESGDTVEEGQVLATLDEASIASELLEVKENIESVEDEIDDLSSDAQTEGTTEYLQTKVLNGELTELQEAETTLTGWLETQTITATCAGTVSSVNVEADTEITKSSGSSSSGSSSSGSSSSAAATGMSTAGSSTSESSDSSETTTSSDSTSSTNTSASGTYSLMFLSASTSGTSASSAESTTDTTEAQTQNTDSKAVYVSTESDTTETSDSEKITSVDVKVTAPKTGEKPQTTITETDQYTGIISWNCSTDTFEAGTSYTADIRLTAKDGYVFSTKILPEISGADITSEVLENDAGQSVLRIKAKFTKTSAKDSNNNGSNNNGSSNDAGSSTGNNGNSSNGNTSNSGTASGAISSGGASSGSTSGVNESGATATGGTTGGTASGSSESVSSDSGSAAGSSDSSDSVSTDGSSTSAQYSAYETAAFSIASDEKATVSVNVDELDITSVKEGQTAKITLDAIDGEEFEGTITSVSSEASSGSSSAKYPVEITFDKTDDMRIGMTASASISIDEAEDVVLIPVDALQEKGNKTFVYTEKDSDGNLSGEVEVETGLSNGNKVEITSGLKSGDTVYYLKTTSSGSSDSQQNMQDMGGGPGGNGEAPSGDRGGNGGGPGGNSGEAPSGGPGGSSSN
nr:biotin/lipoyl-binding protein [uncultured Dorea sp.]